MKKGKYVAYEPVYGDLYYYKTFKQAKDSVLTDVLDNQENSNHYHEIIELEKWILDEKYFVGKRFFKVNKKIIELWLKFFGKRLLKKYKNGITPSFIHLFDNYYIVNYNLIKKLEILTFENKELKFIKV